MTQRDRSPLRRRRATVTHDGELVTDQIPGWAPTTTGSLGGARGRATARTTTGSTTCACRRLPPRHRRRRVRCHAQQWLRCLFAGAARRLHVHGDRRVLLLADEGPTDGNTTVVLKGSMLAGGSDYRCRFGAEGTTVAATYEPDEEELTCLAACRRRAAPGSDRGAAVVALEVSLNNRYYSSTGVPWRFYLLFDVDDARGPDRCARRPDPPPPYPPRVSPVAPPPQLRRRRRRRAASSSVPTSAAETTISRASSRRPR